MKNARKSRNLTGSSRGRSISSQMVWGWLRRWTPRWKRIETKKFERVLCMRWKGAEGSVMPINKDCPRTTSSKKEWCMLVNAVSIIAQRRPQNTDCNARRHDLSLLPSSKTRAEEMALPGCLRAQIGVDQEGVCDRDAWLRPCPSLPLPHPRSQVVPSRRKKRRMAVTPQHRNWRWKEAWPKDCWEAAFCCRAKAKAGFGLKQIGASMVKLHWSRMRCQTDNPACDELEHYEAGRNRVDLRKSKHPSCEAKLHPGSKQHGHSRYQGARRRGQGRAGQYQR